VLLFLAAATMLIGVLGALGRNSIREILSFHIISQVGYMVFGLALFTPLAIAAGIFYIVHHIIVKTALFFAGGIAERVGGTGALGAVRGMAKTHPWVAVGFFIPAMALAGLPPFSGFWGKFFLIVAGFQAGAWASTTIAIVVGLLTLASMMKIWTYTFWGEPEGQQHPALGREWGMLAGTLSLAALSVIIGLAGRPLFRASEPRRSCWPGAPTWKRCSDGGRRWASKRWRRRRPRNTIDGGPQSHPSHFALQGRWRREPGYSPSSGCCSSELLAGQLRSAGFVAGFIGLAFAQPVLGSGEYVRGLRHLPPRRRLLLRAGARQPAAGARHPAPGDAVFQPGFVKFDARGLQPTETVLLGLMISLTPGTLCVDATGRRQDAHIHSLYAQDPAKLQRGFRSFAT
jgi:hypothetical protein